MQNRINKVSDLLNMEIFSGTMLCPCCVAHNLIWLEFLPRLRCFVKNGSRFLMDALREEVSRKCLSSFKVHTYHTVVYFSLSCISCVSLRICSGSCHIQLATCMSSVAHSKLLLLSLPLCRHSPLRLFSYNNALISIQRVSTLIYFLVIR